MSPPLSATGRVLQRRAIQCSFSSVFHLRGHGGVAGKDSDYIEKIFMRSVGFPLGLMVLLGGAASFTKENSSK